MKHQVVDTRPVAARPNFSSTAGVEKYVLPEEEYEKKTDSVLAWKKAQQLGRKCWQLAIVAPGPAVLDGDAAAFDIARLL